MTATLSGKQRITLDLQEDSVARLNAATTVQQASLESVLENLIQNHLPPVAREDRTAFDERVEQLSALSRDQLQNYADAKLMEPEQTRLSQLTARSKQGMLSEQDVQEREALLDQVEAVATTRAAATWLVQQRGDKQP